MPKKSMIISSIDKARLKLSIEHYIKYFIAKRTMEISKEEALKAISLAVREFAMDKMYETIARYNEVNTKRVYYLSVEYLLGRSLENNLYNLGLFDILMEVKIDGFPNISIEEIFDAEYDPALGNGGLGRLAACYMDSMASVGLPGFGYGINYKFGLFKQTFENGYQVEQADMWDQEDSPWQFARPDRIVKIPINGDVETFRIGNTNTYTWLNTDYLYGVPYDFPIVGYDGKSVNYLRLFSAKSGNTLDINIFNEGGYIDAVKDNIETETISKVLYPSDALESGKELRLKQQYFFVSCAIQDIIRRFMEKSNDFKMLPKLVCIQLNDTHPAIAIPEMMRLLMDTHGQSWEDAWSITSNVFAYTNHTLLPEALETWSVSLFEKMLPRHLQIIFEINRRFIEDAKKVVGNDSGILNRLSIVSGDNGNGQVVRMANLSIVGSFKVNGVAKLHSELIKTELVPDFYKLWPQKFTNVTNGVTPRRWLLHANNKLAKLITEHIGENWIIDLDELKKLEKLVDNEKFVEKFAEIKRYNKKHLTQRIFKLTGVVVNPDSMFIVHAKRIHEYKRQLMTIMQVIGDYLAIIKDNVKPLVPRTYIFAGKAAPSYKFAKLIIKLINNVADVVNNDPLVNDMLKVVFIPDYKVSVAEFLIPAADLSVQSSTAGYEASGTGNMKFAINGALTVGTLDGANIEIRDAVGKDNFYLFGLTEEEVNELQHNNAYHPADVYNGSEYVKRIMNVINSSTFCEKDYVLIFKLIFDELYNRDSFFVLKDLESFNEAIKKAEKDYLDKAKWEKSAILNVARMGYFSSDRSVLEYAKKIWNIKPC